MLIRPAFLVPVVVQLLLTYAVCRSNVALGTTLSAALALVALIPSFATLPAVLAVGVLLSAQPEDLAPLSLAGLLLLTYVSVLRFSNDRDSRVGTAVDMWGSTRGLRGF